MGSGCYRITSARRPVSHLYARGDSIGAMRVEQLERCFRARMHVEFLVDGAQMGAQGVHADAERPGNVLLQPALREESKHLLFALREALHPVGRLGNRLEVADDL